jgi:hypothetical protein
MQIYYRDFDDIVKAVQENQTAHALAMLEKVKEQNKFVRRSHAERIDTYPKKEPVA